MTDFKETCIWMSYRYAIGRKSITSVMHAKSIAEHIDWIPEDRREFAAMDIIREVNDRIHWYKNVHVDGYGEKIMDVFSVLLQWFLDNPQDNPVDYFMEHKWDVDVNKGTVFVSDRDDIPEKSEYGTYYEPDIFNEFSDYKDWVNLAKYLRGATHNITIEFEDKITTEPVIEWYDVVTCGGKYEIRKKYTKASEFPGWYISPEYIKIIDKIG
jgi:hypothetical protein